MKYTVDINIYRQTTIFVPISGATKTNRTLTGDTEGLTAVTSQVKVLSTTKDFKDDNKLSAESLMTKIKEYLDIKTVVSEILADKKESLKDSTIVESRRLFYGALLLPPAVGANKKKEV